jgi:hypothetical protein
MTLDELSAYYENLLPIQYKGQPRARATVGALVKEVLGDPRTLFPDVRDIWDLETATGKQLDLIGNIFGVKRYLYGANTTKDYFGMPQMSIVTPDDPAGFFGMMPIADIPSGGLPVTAWYWHTYPDLYTFVGELDDNTFRRLIKYLILLNSMDHTIDNIDWLFTTYAYKQNPFGEWKNADQWFAPSIHLWGSMGFPVYLTDNRDMTITYNIANYQSGPGVDNVMLISAITTLKAWPKPAGVELLFAAY